MNVDIDSLSMIDLVDEVASLGYKNVAAWYYKFDVDIDSLSKVRELMLLGCSVANSLLCFMCF